MNDLTLRLLAEGYTPENHPSDVRWHSGYREFEYTIEAARQMVWETPCGLLRQGKAQDACGYGSFMGIDYRPENNNLRIGCPYYDEIECMHRDAAMPDGWNCTTQRTDRLYSYEQSVEKLWDAWTKIKKAAWLKVSVEYGYCRCMKWDRPSRMYLPKYDVMTCINNECKNAVCVITKCKRNYQKVNIFYDILRERRYKLRQGLFEFTDRIIEKGVKVFDKAVARTDAEIWLEENRNNFTPYYSRDDRRDSHFSEYHGKSGFGEYDYFEYTITAQNIRIERRESRDLLQDLQDIREGIGVTHASDLLKRKKEKKCERKDKQKAAKERKIERNLKRIVFEGLNTEGKPVSAFTQEWAHKQLEKRGIVTGKASQMDLFSAGLSEE
ncbi:MAG: hypothetical protein DDT20_00864 [Firmicutes bacterium]|nr:hypothetical protein [Bacillota bacterium]